jgi:hypothetical protein
MASFDTEFETYARPDLLGELATATASTVTFTTAAGVTTDISDEAIVGDEFEVERQLEETRGRELRRILTISLETITAPACADHFTVGGVKYDILRMENKGSGMVDLVGVRFADDYVHGPGHHDRRFT